MILENVVLGKTNSRCIDINGARIELSVSDVSSARVVTQPRAESINTSATVKCVIAVSARQVIASVATTDGIVSGPADE